MRRSPHCDPAAREPEEVPPYRTIWQAKPLRNRPRTGQGRLLPPATRSTLVPGGQKGEVPDSGPATEMRQAAGGNGREPTIRELQSGIQANRRRIIRLEKQTRKGFKRQHRETRELRDLQNQMLGQMRAMIWIMGVIGGVTVLSLLGGVLVPAVARLITPLAGG